MAAGTWSLTNNMLGNTVKGQFDWDTDTFKVSLMTSSAVLAASTVGFSTVSAHEFSGNGYAAATCSMTITSSLTKVYVDGTDCSWVASGGSIVAKYAVLYESASDVAMYMLLDSTSVNVTTTNGNTLTLQIAADGIFSIS